MTVLFLAILTTILDNKAMAVPVRIDNSQIGKQLNLPIYEWIDKNKKQKGTIIAIHGLTLYAASWDNYAKHLASKGFRVLALDQRGFGRWRTQSSKFGGTDKVEISRSEQDLLDLVTIVRQNKSQQKLFLLGESLGSNMALLLCSEHPELMDGAILAALCYKARIHPKPAYWIKDLAKEIIRPNAPLNLTPYSAPYLTNDPMVAKSCDADPIINRKLTPAELVKFDRLNDNAISAAKSLPLNFSLLLISGSQDAMFKSGDLADLVPKFGSKNITLRLMMGKGHLLLEHQRVDPQIVALIDTWLAKQIQAKKRY